MPNTITAFYEFSPGTKARSSEENTNWSTRRGTFLPMEENTAAASHNSHDLGTSDHRWVGVYAGNVDLRGMTSTSNLVLRNNTSLTVGCAEFLLGSQTLGNFTWGEFGFLGQTTTQYTKFKYQSGITSGVLDLLMGASTLATFSTDGLKHRTKAPMEFTTSSAPVGTALYSGETSPSFLCSTTGSMTIGTFRFNAKGGGIVHVSLANSKFYMSSATTTAAGVDIGVRLYRGTTTTAMTLAAAWAVDAAGGGGSTFPADANAGTDLSYPLFQYFDSSVAAGEILYEWRAVGNTGFPVNSVPRFYAFATVFIREL